jgi:hypothetical protein
MTRAAGVGCGNFRLYSKNFDVKEPSRRRLLHVIASHNTVRFGRPRAACSERKEDASRYGYRSQDTWTGLRDEKIFWRGRSDVSRISDRHLPDGTKRHNQRALHAECGTHQRVAQGLQQEGTEHDTAITSYP